jgi:hypothetical protein
LGEIAAIDHDERDQRAEAGHETYGGCDIHNALQHCEPHDEDSRRGPVRKL